METPKAAGTSPKMIELEAGSTYAWCACGKSEDGIWCNGAHKGSGIAPTVFTAEESKMAPICTCKATKTPPYCDGSHMGLST